ncbi:hypothetical protein CEXT_172931 [Caerostris extrusa]|uniref:Uncharacterized protein n=1 Tax=Caerostris extrusa TaxID=172846 RepID=A0AAV4MKX2_CAEEX|nr:hypothetical protein CEXT_172931 [Caerostris extrusa]
MVGCNEDQRITFLILNENGDLDGAADIPVGFVHHDCSWQQRRAHRTDAIQEQKVEDEFLYYASGYCRETKQILEQAKSISNL